LRESPETNMKGESIMATYIILTRWTQKGIENVKESPDRLDAAQKAFKDMGAELKEFYLVQGQYDMVVVGEAPDDETVAKLALAIGSAGAVRTEALCAFTEDEYRKIIAALP
jgi:uncharacterized protein with GYD domain